MRTQALVVLLIGLGAATAVAAPRDHKLPQSDGSSMNVTVVAGKGRLGISVLQISRDLRTHFGAPADRGVLVDSVRADSPAAKAGVQVGDVIIDLDAAQVGSASDLLSSLSTRKKGDTVGLAVIRNGARVDLKATLEDDPGPAWQSGQFQMGDPNDMFDKLPFDKFQQWQPFDQDLRRQMQELQRRMEQLERKSKT
jgi:membrane-associated protease RseP (regulator of RpoE activity)